MATELGPNLSIFQLNDTNLAEGPYVINKATGELLAICRLFSDTHQAFISGVVPDPQSPSSFKELVVETAESHLGQNIAVPSRLYDEDTEMRPLAGVSPVRVKEKEANLDSYVSP